MLYRAIQLCFQDQGSIPVAAQQVYGEGTRGLQMKGSSERILRSWERVIRRVTEVLGESSLD